MHSLPQVSVHQLHDILQTVSSDTIQLIDVREPDELAIASLESLGFCNYALSQYEQWSQLLPAQLDRHKPTYVLCHHGMRSARMAMWLIQQGFTDVHNISGGIAAWSDSVDASVPQY